MSLSCWFLRALLWEEDLWQLLFKWGNMWHHSGEPAGVPLYVRIYWRPLSLPWVLHPLLCGGIRNMVSVLHLAFMSITLAITAITRKHWSEFCEVHTVWNKKNPCLHTLNFYLFLQIDRIKILPSNNLWVVLCWTDNLFPFAMLHYNGLWENNFNYTSLIFSQCHLPKGGYVFICGLDVIWCG